jgi:hypothetical protein
MTRRRIQRKDTGSHVAEVCGSIMVTGFGWFGFLGYPAVANLLGS